MFGIRSKLTKKQQKSLAFRVLVKDTLKGKVLHLTDEEANLLEFDKNLLEDNVERNQTIISHCEDILFGN